eukprot:TRINITY_DN39806_c0_g2_i1.p1 TRINITY_DN39806_c0_g2~~TRINITY_DN39806_c0_g2_i1.p1  ORF type:complete len:388 (-),score=51.45 TRINITY_DN39806_c0_g2_i1:7-1170(-)
MRTLAEAVLQDDTLFQVIGMFASQGSLQMLSMSGRSWLKRAYDVPTAAWSFVDMAAWPFGLKEIQHTRKQAEKRERKRQRRQEHEHLRERIREGAVICVDEYDAIIAESFSDFSSGDEDVFPHSISLAPQGFLGGDWYKRSSLNDTNVLDKDLEAALKRIAPGAVLRLAVSSSAVTASAVCRALHVHGAGLLQLCLNGCGPQRLRSDALQGCLNGCAALQSLELHGVGLNLPSAATGLTELMLGQDIPEEVVAQAKEFPALRTLKVAGLRPVGDLSTACFLEIFRACEELRDVRIYAATQVTNEMLACLMQHTQHLERFCGSRNRIVPSLGMVPFAVNGAEVRLPCGGLSREAYEACCHHFRDAEVQVDDILSENLGVEPQGDCVIV